MACGCDASRSCVCLVFFQAEDGIRDLTVTGVQTCALPIWTLSPSLGQTASMAAMTALTAMDAVCPRDGDSVLIVRAAGGVGRSEERRVGKGGRSRGWRFH